MSPMLAVASATATGASNAEQICRRFIEEDESAPVVVVIVTAAALLSLVAIIAVLSTIKQVVGTERVAHMLLAALTIVDSWLLVPTIFTVQYADMFYSATAEERPLHFPKTSMPIFWDFAYFSFTIAAACQTADVSTTATVDSQSRDRARADLLSVQRVDPGIRDQRVGRVVRLVMALPDLSLQSRGPKSQAATGVDRRLAWNHCQDGPETRAQNRKSRIWRWILIGVVAAVVLAGIIYQSVTFLSQPRFGGVDSPMRARRSRSA
jgi:hypothetical protein